MKIETVRGNFSQFSKSLLVRVSDNNVTLDAYIDPAELRSFALMLIDVADDALSKIGDKADNCQSMLRDCYAKLGSNDWDSEAGEVQS